MASSPRMIQKGDIAPNFSLKDQDDHTFDLLEQETKYVLLSFHPLAWTSTCTAQMKGLEENRKELTSLNAIAVGISVDSVPCKKAWAESLNISETRLLCDFWPHGKVAQLYGVFRETNGFSERSNILLDEHQKVIFSKVYPIHAVPEIQEVIDFLRAHPARK